MKPIIQIVLKGGGLTYQGVGKLAKRNQGVGDIRVIVRSDTRTHARKDEPISHQTFSLVG